MSKRNADVYLQDILESIQQIEEYLKEVTEDEFYRNTEKQDAVLRRLEIIGEAVKNIPDSIREEHDEVPWKQIAGMRDVIVHAYFGVTLGMIWMVAQQDLPVLRDNIWKIINTNEA